MQIALIDFCVCSVINFASVFRIVIDKGLCIGQVMFRIVIEKRMCVWADCDEVCVSHSHRAYVSHSQGDVFSLSLRFL